MALKIRMPSSRSLMDYLGAASPGSMFMLPTDTREIESTCLSLDHSKGPWHDDASPLVVQFVASEILSIVRHEALLLSSLPIESWLTPQAFL